MPQSKVIHRVDSGLPCRSPRKQSLPVRLKPSGSVGPVRRRTKPRPKTTNLRRSPRLDASVSTESWSEIFRVSGLHWLNHLDIVGNLASLGFLLYRALKTCALQASWNLTGLDCRASRFDIAAMTKATSNCCHAQEGLMSEAPCFATTNNSLRTRE